MSSPITVIIELHAKPGKRDELAAFVGRVTDQEGPRAAGYLGSTRYEVENDPDRLIELARWESVEARAAHMSESAASGVYAPLANMLAEPARVTIARQLP
jgi:quinol monooxygenase YgiN